MFFCAALVILMIIVFADNFKVLKMKVNWIEKLLSDGCCNNHGNYNNIFYPYLKGCFTSYFIITVIFDRMS